MKPRLISLSDAARLVGKTRETVAKAAQGLTAKPGPKNSKLYNANWLMMALYRGNDVALLYEGDYETRERMARGR